MSSALTYIGAYAPAIQRQVEALLEQDRLGQYLLAKYPEPHQVTTDKALRDYAMAIKNARLKQSAPLSQVRYDDKIHSVHNALGTHSYVSRVQGSKVKRKNEIRIARVFKTAPEAFLNMIVVHELAHLKEKQHNRAFYQLCRYMQPDYHQLELDMRIYLIQLEQRGPVYPQAGLHNRALGSIDHG